MEKSEFNQWFKKGLKENIVTSDLFNTAGYFWINLNAKQHRVIYDLLLSQGATEIDFGISLQNGMRILNPDRDKTPEKITVERMWTLINSVDFLWEISHLENIINHSGFHYKDKEELTSALASISRELHSNQ